MPESLIHNWQKHRELSSALCSSNLIGTKIHYILQYLLNISYQVILNSLIVSNKLNGIQLIDWLLLCKTRTIVFSLVCDKPISLKSYIYNHYCEITSADEMNIWVHITIYHMYKWYIKIWACQGVCVPEVPPEIVVIRR